MLMGVRARNPGTDSPKASDSPKAEVGEIDTRAPFASVRAAVSLFGKTVTKRNAASKKPKAQPVENLLAEESQLHLAQKELNKLKEQLHNAETTCDQALTELDSAKKIVEVLSHELNTINQSKELALEVTEIAKGQTKQLEEVSSSLGTAKDESWKEELERAREHYAVAVTELSAAKQELRSVRKEFDTSMDAKASSFQQESDAKQFSIANIEKADQLSKEIAAVQESLMQVKRFSEQAQEHESKDQFEKETRWQSYRLAVEEYERKLASLKKDFNPDLNMSLEAKLAETTAEIEAIQKEIEVAKVTNLLTEELIGAKGELLVLSEEENSLKSLVESLKLELEAVIKEHSELKQKDVNVELYSANLQEQLHILKCQLEEAIVAEAKANAETVDLASTLQQLSVESEAALQEAEAMKKNADEFRHEAESARTLLAEAEMKLEIALCDAEVAKAAEAGSLTQIKELSERADACRSSISEHGGEQGAKITISMEEYNSLSRKVEESEKLAQMKVSAAMAQVEAVRSSESETLKRMEATKVEIEHILASTQEALKRAEMADAAKKAVEGELKRWWEKEQKEAAESSAFERQMSKKKSPPRPKIPMVSTADNSDMQKKMFRPSVTKRSLLPSLSGIFQRRKNHVD